MLWHMSVCPHGEGVPTFDGERVPTFDGEGVPTLNGGVTYLVLGEGVPTLDR